MALISVAGATEYVGFHGDGTGVYPDARPPVTWSAGKNVVWRAVMPNWSNAQPVAKDGRVFVLSEPLDVGPILVCLDDVTGQELWRREINHLDAATSTAYSAWHAKVRQAVRQAHAGTPTMVPKLDKALEAKGAHWPEWGLKPGQTFTVTRGKGGWQYVGHAFNAPVTDGQRVWVWCAPGVAACFDRDGRQVWLRYFDPKEDDEPFKGGCTFTQSPVIVAGTLVLVGGNVIRGLDPDTGEVRWQHKLLNRTGWQPAAPKVVTVAGEPAVFVVDGGVYRIRDGKVMASGFGKPVEAGTMAREDTVFLAMRDGGRTFSRGVKLSPGPEDTWVANQLWESDGLISPNHCCLTPVWHDGKIYGSRGNVWDAGTGQMRRAGYAVRYSSPIITGPYLIARQGRDSEGAQAFEFTDPKSGVTGESLVHVYDLTTMKLLAVNALPNALMEGAKREQVLSHARQPFWSPKGYQTIFCSGDRLYIRTHDDLWCIGEPSQSSPQQTSQEGDP